MPRKPWIVDQGLDIEVINTFTSLLYREILFVRLATRDDSCICMSVPMGKLFLSLELQFVYKNCQQMCSKEASKGENSTNHSCYILAMILIHATSKVHLTSS